MFNLIGNFGLNLTPLPTQSVSQQGRYNWTYIELGQLQNHHLIRDIVLMFSYSVQRDSYNRWHGSLEAVSCPCATGRAICAQLNILSSTIATLFSPKQTYMRNAKLHGWAGASCYLEMPGQEAMSWLSVTTFCFKSHQQQIWQTCVTSFFYTYVRV